MKIEASLDSAVDNQQRTVIEPGHEVLLSAVEGKQLFGILPVQLRIAAEHELILGLYFGQLKFSLFFLVAVALFGQ